MTSLAELFCHFIFYVTSYDNLFEFCASPCETNVLHLTLLGTLHDVIGRALLSYFLFFYVTSYDNLIEFRHFVHHHVKQMS